MKCVTRLRSNLVLFMFSFYIFFSPRNRNSFEMHVDRSINFLVLIQSFEIVRIDFFFIYIFIWLIQVIITYPTCSNISNRISIGFFYNTWERSSWGQRSTGHSNAYLNGLINVTCKVAANSSLCIPQIIFEELTRIFNPRKKKKTIENISFFGEFLFEKYFFLNGKP